MGRHNLDTNNIIKRDGHGCHYCGKRMKFYPNPTAEQQRDPKRFTYEHIVPASMGGTWGMYNIVGACNACNQQKGNQYFKCFCEFCQMARVRFELKEMRVA